MTHDDDMETRVML